MFDVSTIENKAMSLVDVETQLLTQPQVSAPVIHRFGPGIYIRELHMSAGTLAVGKVQKFEHTNILLQGSVLMFNEDGTTKLLEAPLFFIGKPGRKCGLVMSDVVWQNIYATNETDISVLEDTYMENSDAGTAHAAAEYKLKELEALDDQLDYKEYVSTLSLTEEEIQEQVNITTDLVEFENAVNLRVADSPIHGKGLYTTTPIKEGATICYGRVNNCRTPAGRYTNHSVVPNCKMVLLPNGDVTLVALEDILGCTGGSVGTELTINYRDVNEINPSILNKELTCQD